MKVRIWILYCWVLDFCLLNSKQIPWTFKSYFMTLINVRYSENSLCLMETTTLPSCKDKSHQGNKIRTPIWKIQIKEKICHSLIDPFFNLLTVNHLYWDNSSIYVSSPNSLLNSRLHITSNTNTTFVYLKFAGSNLKCPR